MNTHPTARGRWPAVVGLIACFTWVGVPALAATTPTDVSMAPDGGGNVRAGETVSVTGRITPASRGWAVRLQFAPNGGPFEAVAGTRTAADGSYSIRYKVTRSGLLRAQAERGRPSSVQRVVVMSSLRARWRKHVLGAGMIRVGGVLKPAQTGRSVRLQVRRGGGWHTVDGARTRAGGRFDARWDPPRAGRYRMRLAAPRSRSAAAARTRTRTVYVYRPGNASYYGPGLYGNPVSCGGTLTGGKLGVAHKSLPCGTQVTFRHRGRSVTVRVIDRGPFAAGREWDLTAATKQRLGFGSTGTVWSTR